MSAQEQTIVGGRALDDLLKTLPAKMEKNIMRAALRAGAAIVLPEVKERIPVASGQLRASARITTRYKKGETTASVKVGNFVAWYAHLVEFGTRPHKIKAKDSGALAFGGMMREEVEHPGITGHPFMRPAADASYRDAIKAVESKIRQRLTAQGLNVPAPIPSDPEE